MKVVYKLYKDEINDQLLQLLQFTALQHKFDSVTITFDTEHTPPNLRFDDSHIPRADDDENEELLEIFNTMSDDEKQVITFSSIQL